MRTRADCAPFFLSVDKLPSNASLNVHTPVLKVTLPVAYAVLVPLSKFSVVTVAAKGTTAEVLVAVVCVAFAGTVDTRLSLLHWLQDKAIMKMEKVNNGLNCFIVDVSIKVTSMRDRFD